VLQLHREYIRRWAAAALQAILGPSSFSEDTWRLREGWAEKLGSWCESRVDILNKRELYIYIVGLSLRIGTICALSNMGRPTCWAGPFLLRVDYGLEGNKCLAWSALKTIKSTH